MATFTPEAAQRELAWRLAGLRRAAGLTQQQVAAELLSSDSAISRLETGTGSPVLRTVRDLGHLYQLDWPEIQELMELARVARGRHSRTSAPTAERASSNGAG